MKKILFLLILIPGFCFSQKKDKRNGVYTAYLNSVEVSKNAKLGTVDTLLSSYEDSIIKINWICTGSHIEFDLTNKSEQTLKLVWDDAAFISQGNESGKIFHKGVKYIDRENSQPPTSIYKKTSLSDLIAPTSYVYYVSGRSAGWRTKTLIPFVQSLLGSKVEYNEDLIGQTMRVILPIRIEEQTVEYTFNFKTVFLQKMK